MVERYDYDVRERKEWVVKDKQGNLLGAYPTRGQAVDKVKEVKKASTNERTANVKNPSRETVYRVHESEIGGTSKRATRSRQVGTESYLVKSGAEAKANQLRDKSSGAARFYGTQANDDTAGLRGDDVLTPEEITELTNDPVGFAEKMFPVEDVVYGPEENPAVTEVRDKLLTSVNKYLSEVRGLKNIQVAVVDTINGEANAEYNSVLELMTVALDGEAFQTDLPLEKQINEVNRFVNHELIHYALRAGLVSNAEYQVLVRLANDTEIKPSELATTNRDRAADGLEPIPADTTYDELVKGIYGKQAKNEGWIPDDMSEEAIAFMAQDYGDDRSSVPAEAGTIFRRIGLGLSKLRNALQGAGFRSSDQVYSVLFGKEFANRLDSSKVRDAYWYRRRNSPEYKALVAKIVENRGTLTEETERRLVRAGVFDPVPSIPLPVALDTGEEAESTARQSKNRRTGVVDSSSPNAHILDIQRGERVVGKRVTWVPGERAAIAAKSAELGVPKSQVEALVRFQKRRFPAKAGWKPWVFNEATVTLDREGNPAKRKNGSFKIKVEPKKIPYQYNKDKNGKDLSPAKRASAVKALARNTVGAVQEVVDRADNGDLAAEVILRQAGWYRQMRSRLRREYGSLGDLFADLLGATSPKTPVKTNWASAVEALGLATTGAYDKLMPQWEAWQTKIDDGEQAFLGWVVEQQELGKTMAQIERSGKYKRLKTEMSALRKLPDKLNPRKKDGTTKFGSNGRQVVKVMVDLWRTIKNEDTRINRGATAPKAQNFSGNLIGFKSRATIDVWAGRFLERLRWGSLIPSAADPGIAGDVVEGGGTTGAFGFGQDVFSEAVRLIKSDPNLSTVPELKNLNDDDLQALVWFIEKEVWAKADSTTADGEGGSFEFEADFTGSTKKEQINSLRKIIGSKKSSAEDVAVAKLDLEKLKSRVSRSYAGVAVETSEDIQGVDFVPTDGQQAAVSSRMLNRLLELAPEDSVVGVNIGSTQGFYFGEPERAFNFEVVGRESFDPIAMRTAVMEVARDGAQDAAFVSRVLDPSEDIDILRHRPGIEVYFQESLPVGELQEILTKISDVLDGYTVVVDARRSTDSLSGAMPKVVGIRSQWIPEFDVRYGGDKPFQSTDPEVNKKESKDRVRQINKDINALLKNVSGITYADVVWSETDVRFEGEYDSLLEEGGQDANSVGSVRRDDQRSGRRQFGRTIAEGVEAASRRVAQVAANEAAGTTPFGRDSDSSLLDIYGEPRLGTARKSLTRKKFKRDPAQDNMASPLDKDKPTLPPYKPVPQSREPQKLMSELSWGNVRFNSVGKYSGKGPGLRVFISAGSKDSFGERHIERHNKDIAENTPYSNTEEFLTGFFDALKSAPKNLEGSYITPYYDPFGGKMNFFWDDPGFKSPGVVVMEYLDGPRTYLDGPRYSVITAYADSNFTENAQNESFASGVRRGKNADVRSVMEFERYSQGKRGKQFIENRERINKAKGFTGRRSVNRRSINTPAQQKAVDAYMGRGKTAQPVHNKSLLGSFISGLTQNYNIPFWEEFRARMVDQYNGVAVNQSAADRKRRADGKLGLTIPEMAAMSAHSMMMMTDKAGAFVESMLKYGTIDYTGLAGQEWMYGTVTVNEMEMENSVEDALVFVPGEGIKRVSFNEPNLYSGTGGLNKILSVIGSMNESLLDKFYAYSRAVRAHTKVREEGKPVPVQFLGENMENALQFGYDHPEIAIAHANLQKWNDSLITFAVKSGVLNDQQAEIWRQYADYVPFYLDTTGEMSDEMRARFKTALGSSDDFKMLNSMLPKAPSKKYKGMTEGELVDPVEATIRNTMAMISESMKNIASWRFIKNMEVTGDARRLDPNNAEDNKITGNVVTVYENGKSVRFEVTDIFLHDTMVGAFEADKALGSITSAMSIPARLLREGVTRMPDFLLANTTRDAFLSWLLHKTSSDPVSATADSLRRILSDVKNREEGGGATQRAIAMGGGSGGYELRDLDLNKMKNRMDRRLTSSSSPVDAIKKTWDLLGDVGNFSESAARQRVFERTYARTQLEFQQQGKEAGLTGDALTKYADRHATGEAAFQAMEVLNFARRGNAPLLRFLTAVVPFLNARIQGLDVFYRNGLLGENTQGLDNDVAKRALMRRASYVASATLLYTLMHYDDDDFENTEEYRRLDNWLIPLGPLATERQKYFAIPIPFEAGILLKVLPEALIRNAMGESTGEGVRAVKHSIMNTLAFNPIPQAIKPFVETWANKNSFTGQPIIPQYMLKLDPAEQYRESTSGAAKILGKASGFSPLQIDSFMKGYLGSSANYINAMLDLIIHRPAFGLTERPQGLVSDTPFIRRFLVDDLGGGNAEDFYRFRDEVDRVVNTVNILKKRDPSRVESFVKSNREVLAARDYAREIGKVLSRIRDRRNLVMSSSMSRSEKGKMLRELRRIEIEVMSKPPKM